MGLIAEPRKAALMEQISVMFSSYFVQRTGPGGAVHGVRGGIVMGWIGRPGTAAVERGSRRSCTLVALFSRGGRGGAAVAVGGERQGLERAGPEEPRSRRKPRVEK